MGDTVWAMILERLDADPQQLARRTGWEIRPEGACKADRCVPLPEPPGANVDVRVLAERLGMALVHDEYGHFKGVVTPADVLDAIV